MKKGSLFFVALWLWMSAAAQYWAWKPDSLTRRSADPYVLPSNPADTLCERPHRIDFERQYTETPHTDGGSMFRFDIQEYNMNWVMREHCASPLRLTRAVGKGVDFEADWCYFVPREYRADCYYPYYDPQEIFQSRDTLISVIYPAETGGVTPEGQTYRFCGDRVKRVTTQTRAVFDVSVVVVSNPREGWHVPIGQLAVPVRTTPVGACGYRLPILREVTLDAMQAATFRTRVVKTLREYLGEKRASVIADGWYGDPELRAKELDELQSRLTPGWNDGRVRPFSDFSATIEFRCFVTDAVVEMKDGRTERFVHMATYETNIP